MSTARDLVWNVGARGLAAGAFLFLLNAFIQSGAITAAEAGVGLGWLAVCYWLSGRFPLPHVLVATFLACVAWGLFLESRPLSDWHRFHVHARDLAAGSLHQALFSKSLTTTLYQGLFHWLLGSSWVTNYIAGAGLWTAGAAGVYAALRPFTAHEPRLARFVCVALALCPTFLVFSPVVGSKGMFFLLSAICAWLLSRHVRRAGQTPYRHAVGLGLATALLFLTRPHGVLLLAVCLPVVALLPAPSRRNTRAAALMLGVFAAVVLGYGGLSYANGYGFKVVAHQGDWQSLLHGTNMRSSGMHSMEALERLELPFDRAHLPEVKKRAREMAFDSVLSDVPGFVRFAFTTKMEVLYGRDPKLFRRVRGDDTPTDAARTDRLKTQVQPVAERVEQGVYRLVFLLFLVLLIRQLWRPSLLLGLGGVVLLYSLPHLLLEVDQRYHMLMLPYFVMGAVFLIYELAAATRRGCRRKRPRRRMMEIAALARRARFRGSAPVRIRERSSPQEKSQT